MATVKLFNNQNESGRHNKGDVTLKSGAVIKYDYRITGVSKNGADLRFFHDGKGYHLPGRKFVTDVNVAIQYMTECEKNFHKVRIL